MFHHGLHVCSCIAERRYERRLPGPQSQDRISLALRESPAAERQLRSQKHTYPHGSLRVTPDSSYSLR